MRNDWRHSSTKIGGRKAIEHKLNMEDKTRPVVPAFHEPCLSGRYGEVWLWSNIENKSYKEPIYAAVITSAKLANKLAPKYGKTTGYKIGDEMVIMFGQKDLANVILQLKIPKSQATQVTLANSFSER